MSYNGWANWETWNMHRWLTMDDDTTHAALAAAQSDGGNGVREYVARDMLGPALESAPMAADFLNNTLDQIEWDAIASEIMERVETP